MSRKFKPGDVVFYDRGEQPLGVGIIKGYDDAKTVRFERHQEGGPWHGEGIWGENGCKLHPDPDAVWAEYCAWRLTHG